MYPHAKSPVVSALSVALACLAAASLVLVATPAVAEDAGTSGSSAEPAEGEPLWPRVVWLEDPAREATISWVTLGDDEGEGHRVHWDLRSRDGQVDSYTQTTDASRHIEEFRENAWFHHVKLEDLHPSATYHFVVESNRETTEEFYFRTAPADDRPVKLLYGGDSRSNPESRRKVNRLLRELYTSDDEIQALVHGGDYIEISMRWSDWQGWLEDWTLTIAEDGRMLPVIPARGNHEFSLNNHQGKPDNYQGIWGDPGGPDRDYWTSRIGSQIAFINLNSNSVMGGKQRDWLEQQLETHSKKRRWLLANYHRPAYPAVKDPGSAKVHWVPLFEKYRVDLVCESDGHVLKRTVPILNDKKHPNGVVYVGEGGLGVKQRTPRKRWYLEPPGMATSAHHVQRLSFAGDTLTYEAIDLENNVIDSKKFDKRRFGNPVELKLDGASLREDGREDGKLEVVFSKGITADSAATAANYAISPELEVTSATRHPDFDNRAVLELGDLKEGTPYSVTADGVQDLLGNEIDGEAGGNAIFGVGLDEPAEEQALEKPDAGGDTEDATSEDTAEASDTPAAPTQPPEEQATCSTVGGPAGLGALLAVLALGVVGWRRK